MKAAVFALPFTSVAHHHNLGTLVAILGCLVQSTPALIESVEAHITTIPELTSYGIQQECYIVVVAEAHSSQLEALMSQVRDIEGVISVAVTSLHLEDEMETQ